MKAKKEKPLIKMSQTELRDTFDDAGADLRRSILTEARISQRSPGETRKLAVLIVRDAEGRPGVYSYYPEYGDGEGVNHAKMSFYEIVRAGDCLLGETLEVHVLDIPVTSLCNEKTLELASKPKDVMP